MCALVRLYMLTLRDHDHIQQIFQFCPYRVNILFITDRNSSIIFGWELPMLPTGVLEMSHLTYTFKNKSKRRVRVKSLVHTEYLPLHCDLKLVKWREKYNIWKNGCPFVYAKVLPQVRREKWNTNFISKLHKREFVQSEMKTPTY